MVRERAKAHMLAYSDDPPDHFSLILELVIGCSGGKDSVGVWAWVFSWCAIPVVGAKLWVLVRFVVGQFGRVRMVLGGSKSVSSVQKLVPLVVLCVLLRL